MRYKSLLIPKKYVCKLVRTAEWELIEQSSASDRVCESEGRQPVMDAMAGARVRVVISIPWASWKSASYMALIGSTVAVLFATARLWLVPPWKCMPYAQRKTGGVTTCQEIHKQGYLEQEQLYILSVLSRAISCVQGCQICSDTPPHWTLGKKGPSD